MTSLRPGSRAATYAVLALLTVILLYPLWFMVRTSFQTIDQFQRGETEIVILVTPYTVRPVSDQSALQVPNEAPPTSDLDRLLYMRTSSGSNQRTLAQTPGVAGFIVQ